MKRYNLPYYILIFTVLSFYGCEKKNEAPFCKITNPLNNESISQNSINVISVDAADSDGYVIEVRFYIDESEIGLSSTFPYKIDWVASPKELGSHSIKAIAKDDEGESTQDEINVFIGISAIAAFSAVQTKINAGEIIQFIDESINNPTNWRWNFGDGSGSSEENPSHVYSSGGSYSVSLIVRNIFGSDTVIMSNFITVTPDTDTFTDTRDNKTYKTVKIGNQTWMAENLSYDIGIDCWAYNNNENYVDTYGRLYHWEAAKAACPTGWHLPTDDEWKKLEMAIGMSLSEADKTLWRGTNEGTKLKTTSGWYNNENGTDDFYFSALPGGFRNTVGDFVAFNYEGRWWSATEVNDKWAYNRAIRHNYTQVWRTNPLKGYGYSVRCVRD